MRRIKGLVAVLLAVCTVFSVTGCDTVERIKERISQETVDDEKVADENKTEVSNSISVGLLDFDTFNPLLTKSETVKECMEFVYEPLFELNEKLQAVPILAEAILYLLTAERLILRLKTTYNGRTAQISTRMM